ncbi:hypothetical protein JW898_02285 [Candidatus Woesearchaeota archaeon]|nr:hypothetical protein [Candidatus Woesearchaeota archaeon]
MKRSDSAEVAELVSYVGEHWLSDDVVKLLQGAGYRMSDIISPHYHDTQTRCFTRVHDFVADILVENPGNMMCLPLGQVAVMPLYYLNYLRVPSYDVEKYQSQFAQLLDGGKRSSGFLAWAYLVPAMAAMSGCICYLETGDWKSSGIIAASGLFLSLMKLGWNNFRGVCALRDFIYREENEERALGIDALMMSLGGRPLQGGSYFY